MISTTPDVSLQSQLALKTELCGHYETDLKARDELVEILDKKLATLEEDDIKHKNALRSWKKKVQELERLCRQLEEVTSSFSFSPLYSYESSSRCCGSGR